MAHIPIDAVPYLEAAIYLPMLLTVLDKDYAQIEVGDFKLKLPYLSLINETRKSAHDDLMKTKAYLLHHQLKVVRGNSDELFTEYYFHYQQAMEVRKYSNVRLRNRVENLLNRYLERVCGNLMKNVILDD